VAAFYRALPALRLGNTDDFQSSGVSSFCYRCFRRIPSARSRMRFARCAYGIAALPLTVKGSHVLIKVFLLVTAGALIGMVLGGLFECAAGATAPSMFIPQSPAVPVEPVQVAIVMGASFGVLCGGLLGAFALTLQYLWDVHKSKNGRN
jgi:hypothetical protein